MNCGKTKRVGIILAALPGLVMLLLFYSLAFHMHQALGGWPTSIGENGFPQALVIHATVTVNVFGFLMLSLLILPILIASCLLVNRWKRFVPYYASYGGVILLSFGLTQFAAPAQFLNWWFD